MSIILAVCMMISMTACGSTSSKKESSKQDSSKSPTQNTTQYSTESDQDNAPQDPGHDPDGGYWHDEEPSSTEELNPTEEPSSTEEPDNPPTGAYTYDVDGVQITLRTHVEDYISVRASGAYQVNLLGIMENLGFTYDTTIEPRNIQTYFYADNTMHIVFEGLSGRSLYTIYYSVPGNIATINFARNDRDNDEIVTYWIDNGDELTPVKNINFEQIIIFTYLAENAVFAPNEDWIDECGFRVDGSSVYYVNK